MGDVTEQVGLAELGAPEDSPGGTGRGPLLLVGAVVLALLLAAGIAVLVLRSGGDSANEAAVPRATPAVPNGRTAAPGWRLESSLGMEIEVPDDWATNDIRCNQTGAPSVVRGQNVEPACLTPEPVTKSVAEILTAVNELTPGLPRHAVTVDGVVLQRAEGRLADGRYAGSLTAPDGRALDVRTTDQALTKRILDSLHLVEVDHLGCATQRPAGRPTAPSGSKFVPAQPTEIDVCFYDDGNTGRLSTSGALVGPDAVSLATALNAARAGLNKDTPDNCAPEVASSPTNAVLLIRTPEGVRQVFATFTGCLHRGLDNGARYAQLSVDLLQQFMAPLKAGYSWTGGLPGEPASEKPASPLPSALPS